MDTLLQKFPSSISVYPNQSLDNGFKRHHHAFMDPDPPFLPTNPDPQSNSTSPSSTGSSEGDSLDPGDYSNAVLKYIREMLMEEDLEDKTCMLQDCLALQAAEKSFYDVLGQNYPTSKNQLPPCFNKTIDIPDDSFSTSRSIDSNNGFNTAKNLIDSDWVFYQAEFESSLVQPSLYSDIQSSSVILAPKSSLSKPVGVEVKDKTEEDGRFYSPSGSRGRKNHQREGGDYLEERRSNKHSAFSVDEPEQSEMFDEVLLCKGDNDEEFLSCKHQETSQDGSSPKLQQNGQLKGSNNGGTTRGKKQGNKKGVVDLWTLLTQCAQAVASNDQRTANDLLKQIRQHSSPFGDGTQRMAHYFADGLEVRIAGTGTPLYTPIVSHRTSAAEILKAYQVYISACPFKKMSNIFANRKIAKVAEKATKLHIIDIGICYGFQWPCLIQRLSTRPGGPPKIRITGIDLPQPGFRPAERLEETGRRLERYCERFNVQFEYACIAQKWETIQLEDLKIDRDEVTVVNCLYRLRHLPDDTVVINSARDAVLKLIKRINPDIFIHGVVNGTYNAPFFVTRFREAIFHFSSLFDMFEANVPREDQERMLFEREVFGRDAMNVIACEGTERIERPETYKQWQARNLRAGFRQLPLDQAILKKVRTMVKSDYHKDFVIDVDGQWMLQGWKGRVIHALSCWKPVLE